MYIHVHAYVYIHIYIYMQDAENGDLLKKLAAVEKEHASCLKKVEDYMEKCRVKDKEIEKLKRTLAAELEKAPLMSRDDIENLRLQLTKLQQELQAYIYMYI